MRRAPTHFHSDERGAIAILFALMLTATAVITGIAIDYSIGYRDQQNLQQAADAAALSATTRLVDGGTWAEAKERAEEVFAANLPSEIGSPSLHLQRVNTPLGVEVQAFATADWKRTLTQIVTNEAKTIGVNSKAAQPRRPIDIVFVLDVSYSMGIGATTADVDLLNAQTGCAFACHQNGGDANAHSLGAKLRIDVLRDTVIQTLDEIDDLKRPGDVIRAGITTFSNSIVENLAPTTDLAAIRSTAETITMAPFEYQGGTDFHAVLAQVDRDIRDRNAARTDGTQTFVLFISDGLQNSRIILPDGSEAVDTDFVSTTPYISNGWDPVGLTVLDPDLCQDIKDTNAVMMVLSVEYVTQNVQYTEGIASELKPYLAGKAAACATGPGYFKSANAPSEIRAAMRELTLAAVRGKAHLAR